MEILSRVHAKNLVEWARDKKEVVVLSADLTSSTEIDLFRDTYPERFISLGIAEQNMMSFAGGLAREGYRPFVHTFAVFIYRRAYDQIAMSIAYPNLRVRMFGFLPGVMTPGGATHQAIEDISVMRSLPNMTILECGDATEVESVLDVADGVDGPVYIRMLRGEIPRLFPASSPMVLGTSRVLSEGSDLVLLTSGICTEEALRVTNALRKRGVSLHHRHISTLKPFAEEEVLEVISASKYGVLTLENHSVIGGLGTMIAEQMAERGLAKKLKRLGIQDTFVHGASKQYLLREYGLCALSLSQAIGSFLGSDLGIKEEELTEAHIVDLHSKAKAEAL